MLVQPIPLVLMYQHSQVSRDVRTIALQIRHRVQSWTPSSNRQGATSQCSRCHSLHMALSLSLSLSLLPSWSTHHTKCRFKGFTQLCTRLDVHNQFRQSSVSFCFAHPAPARFNRCPIILWWSWKWDPRSGENQSCKLAVDWLHSNICTNFRCGNFLDSEISVLYSFLHPKT